MHKTFVLVSCLALAATFECHTRESPTDTNPDVPMVMAACKTILPL